MASLSLRALAWTKPSRRSLIKPTSCPRATDCENAWISWPETSFAITEDSSRAASRPYSGSSPVSSAAVRIDSSSSSRVVAPSYRPEMVRVATRIGSTACRPSAARVTARTILLRSTASLPPLRLVTRMLVAVGGGVRSKAGSAATAVAAMVCAWDMVLRSVIRTCGPSLGRQQAGGAGEGHRSVSRAGPGRTVIASPAISPRRSAAGTARRAARGCRQVFGLMDAEGRPSSLPVASRGLRPSANDRFVSNYRCGAAPEWPTKASPASLFILRFVAPGTDDPKIRWLGRCVNTKCCVLCAALAAAVLAALLGAGHGRAAAGLAAHAGRVVFGDDPRHRGGDLLAHRDVQELVGAVRVGMRAEHAG